MDKNQKINCTVETCKFNNCDKNLCNLEQIIVEPIVGCESKQPDESMCGSYECKCNND